MKSIALTFLLAALSTGLMAQTEQPKTDTTKVSLGATQILIVDDSDSVDVDWDDSDTNHSDQKYELTHWGGIDVGVNVLLNKNGGTSLDSADQWLQLDYSRSLSFRFNLFEEKIRIYKDYVGIVVGAGLTYNSYGLKKNVTLATNDSLGTFGISVPDSVADFSKNKLRASYINVPLMLEFNTSEDNDKSFHIAAGVIGGWKMGSITKQKWEDGDDKNSIRKKSDFNLTPFTLDLTARVGYKNFTAFATYGVTPLFKKDNGPEVYPLTVGIQFIPF